MKQYKLLSGVLAVCLAGAAVWYGGIALLQRGSRVTLQTEKGDASKLQDIELTASLRDDAFCRLLSIEDGVLHDRFAWNTSNPMDRVLHPTVPVELHWLPVPGAEGESVERTEEDGSVEETLVTSRVQLMVEYWNGETEEYIRIDPDLEIQAEQPRFMFSRNGQRGRYLTKWIPINCDQKCGEAAYWNGSRYLAVQLPWGGVQLYRVTQNGEHADSHWLEASDFPQDMELTVSSCMEDHTTPTGKAEKIAEYSSDDITWLIGLVPMQNGLVMLTQTSTQLSAQQPNENGVMQPLQTPEKSRIEALVFDQNDSLVKRLILLELDEAAAAPKAEYLRCGQPQTGQDDLCVIFRIRDAMEGAAVLRLEPTDARLVDAVQYMTNEDSRKIATVQTDAAGEKMAFVWQQRTASLDDQIYLEVRQKGESVYMGRFVSDTKQDPLLLLDRNGAMANTGSCRAYEFPAIAGSSVREELYRLGQPRRFNGQIIYAGE